MLIGKKPGEMELWGNLEKTRGPQKKSPKKKTECFFEKIARVAIHEDKPKNHEVENCTSCH